MINSMTLERVTITLPAGLVEDIARLSRNRSRFVAEAIRREIERRRREALAVSLESPHAESEEHAQLGWAEWTTDLPDQEASDLVDSDGGRAVRWDPERGWVEAKR